MNFNNLFPRLRFEYLRYRQRFFKQMAHPVQFGYKIFLGSVAAVADPQYEWRTIPADLVNKVLEITKQTKFIIQIKLTQDFLHHLFS